MNLEGSGYIIAWAKVGKYRLCKLNLNPELKSPTHPFALKDLEIEHGAPAKQTPAAGMIYHLRTSQSDNYACQLLIAILK